MQSGRAARSHDMFWPIYIFLRAPIFVYSSLLRATMFTTFEVRRHQVHHHHIVRPGDCPAHPTHTRSDRIVLVAKIQGKARMVHRVGRHANAMGSLGMLGREAHVLLALTMWWWLEWHHMASCGRQMCLLLMAALPHPRAQPFLIKVDWD